MERIFKRLLEYSKRYLQGFVKNACGMLGLRRKTCGDMETNGVAWKCSRRNKTIKGSRPASHRQPTRPDAGSVLTVVAKAFGITPEAVQNRSYQGAFQAWVYLLRRAAVGKTRITIYLDDAILAAFRGRAEAEGRGYQTLINEALSAALAENNAPVTIGTLRKVLREELHAA